MMGMDYLPWPALTGGLFSRSIASPMRGALEQCPFNNSRIEQQPPASFQVGNAPGLSLSFQPGEWNTEPPRCFGDGDELWPGCHTDIISAVRREARGSVGALRLFPARCAYFALDMSCGHQRRASATE